MTLVNFLNAAAVGLGYEEAGIPSCDIEAFELERRRVIARLEAGSSLPASESGPEPFKIPSQMRVCSSANASKQTFERETDLELEPVERSKFESEYFILLPFRITINILLPGPSQLSSLVHKWPSPLLFTPSACLFYGGRQRSPSPPSKPSLPRAPALYTSALGIIERDLSKEKRRVRFDYGTMDSHLWSSAEEYFNTPLLRVARQSEKREQEQTRRREEHASKHWQQKAADSRHRPTVLPCPPTLPTSLPDQALLCAPQSQNRRHAPLGVLSGSPPPSLTYEEPSPAHGYATTEAEGEDNSQETMTIVITSPTGQQHVWGAPSRLVNKISKYLSKLGARQSTGVPDATPTAQKRNAEDEGMDESDPKPCISSQLEVKRRTKSPGLHEMEEVRRQLNLEDPKQEAEAETKAGVKASSQAGPSEDKALTTLGGGPGRPQASPLKRKVDVDELSDDRKVRSKESWLPGNSLPGL